MPVALRLVLIVLAALIASHLVAAIVLFQPFLLFISVASYPVTVAASAVLAYPVHRLIQANRLSSWRQRVTVVPLSLVGTLSAIEALYLQTNASSSWLSYTTLNYLTLGLLTGPCCWVLPNWGPLKLTSVDAGTNARLSTLMASQAISTGSEEGVSAFDAPARVARPHASLVQRPQLEVHRAPSEPIAAGENA